jgi:hypothetical protein
MIQSVGTSSCSSAEVLEYWRRGVMECWSTGVARFVAAAFFSLLITDLLVLITLEATEYTRGRTGSRPYQSPFTFHFSPLPSLPRSINERARGQYDNQDGSFGSDLPIG